MRGFSKAIITGNLTRDPELRTTPNGSNVCSFTVAVNRIYRDANGEQKEDVSFIDCSAWGRIGETIGNYGRKGSGVLVSGRLDQRSWEDKIDGKKRSRVEIIVEDFNFVGGGNGDRQNGGQSYSQSYGQNYGQTYNQTYSSNENYGAVAESPAFSASVEAADAEAIADVATDVADVADVAVDMPVDVPAEELDLSEIPF